MSEAVVFLADVKKIRLDTNCGIWVELLLGKDDEEDDEGEGECQGN